MQYTNGGYDLVPANIMLARVEQELFQTGKEHRLKENVAPVAGDYDFVMIDTPPSLGVLTVNAFTCATDILIPTTVRISQLNATVTNVQKYCNPRGRFGVFSLPDPIPGRIVAADQRVGGYISTPIYKTCIRSAVALEDAKGNRWFMTMLGNPPWQRSIRALTRKL